jgi:SAM-dependent methyltransferase
LDGFNVPSWERRLNERQPPDMVLEALGIGPGMVVAKVGAGRGRYVIHSAYRVGLSGKVYAVDIDKSALEYLRDRCRREGLQNVETILGTVVDPKLQEGTLDLVYIISAYHHLADPVQLLKGIRPSLKPGGRLGIVEREPSKCGHPAWEDGARARDRWEAVRKEDLVEEAHTAGYRLLNLHTFLPQDNIYVFITNSIPIRV